MGTQFSEIYEMNETIKLDTRLFGKPDNLLYSLKFKWLKYAISMFDNDCYQDINTFTPFSQVEYEFVADGINNVYTLNPTPIGNSNFYISVDDSSGYAYTFNSINNQLTITPIPPSNSPIYISAYIIGSFPIDLTIREQNILAEGMLVPWLEQQKNRNDLLNQMVYSGDMKIYSQANHISEVDKVADNQYYKKVKSMINEYSYRRNPNGVKGLGGGLI